MAVASIKEVLLLKSKKDLILTNQGPRGCSLQRYVGMKGLQEDEIGILKRINNDNNNLILYGCQSW